MEKALIPLRHTTSSICCFLESASEMANRSGSEMGESFFFHRSIRKLMIESGIGVSCSFLSSTRDFDLRASSIEDIEGLEDARMSVDLCAKERRCNVCRTDAPSEIRVVSYGRASASSSIMRSRRRNGRSAAAGVPIIIGMVPVLACSRTMDFSESFNPEWKVEIFSEPNSLE